MPLRQSGRRTLKIEGRIDGAGTEELYRAVAGALAARDTLVLDMSGVTYVDRVGVEVLRKLVAHGASLEACSSFLDALLNGEGR
jgi:anti-anti-sigma regulatory factor